MISQVYLDMLGTKSVIRQLSEFATARGKEIGYENVFDYSLGNPSVPVPQAFTHVMMLYMLLHVLVFIYFAFGQISVKEFIKYLIAGTIISCLISLIGHLTNLINYERLIVDEGNGIYRFAGIFPHCNTLVRSCVLGLAGLIVFAFENPKKISNYILMLVLTFIGMSTFSKAFFILMALLILFVVIYSFVKARNKKKWCKWFGILCIIGVLAVILAFPYFKTIFI